MKYKEKCALTRLMHDAHWKHFVGMCCEKVEYLLTKFHNRLRECNMKISVKEKHKNVSKYHKGCHVN